jgi:hypothetical protein
MEIQRREDTPLLVAIDEPRRDSADVRTGTNEHKDNEQEGLEVEKRRLRVRWGVACQFETGRKEERRRTMGSPRTITLSYNL